LLQTTLQEPPPKKLQVPEAVLLKPAPIKLKLDVALFLQPLTMAEQQPDTQFILPAVIEP